MLQQCEIIASKQQGSAKYITYHNFTQMRFSAFTILRLKFYYNIKLDHLRGSMH